MEDSSHAFSLQVRGNEGNLTFYLTGVLDIKKGKTLWEEVMKVEDSCKAVILNLSDVRIISSGGLSMIVDIAKFLEDQKVQFKLTQPSEMVLRTLKFVHIDKIVTIET